jgi:hypothetical protein
MENIKMPKTPSIRALGFRRYYNEVWLIKNPDAIAWDRLENYLLNGDEFGRRVPISLLAKLCKTTKTTILKWLPIFYEQNKKDVQVS